MEFLGLFGLLSVFVWTLSIRKLLSDRQFGETPWLLPMGIFVWGDGVVIGLFWVIASAISCWLKNGYLFGLIASLFWVIRALGEIIYWLNQQFSNIERNSPKNMKGYRLFKNDSIWFGYQVVWQCLFVAAVIFSLYFAKKWLSGV